MFWVALHNFNHMKNIVLIILIHQGEIAVSRSFIGNRSIGGYVRDARTSPIIPDARAVGG
jgi:hypothetical protein